MTTLFYNKNGQQQQQQEQLPNQQQQQESSSNDHDVDVSAALIATVVDDDDDVNNNDNCPFIISSSSLRHLENTALPDDHLRQQKLSKETIHAIAFGFLSSIVGIAIWWWLLHLHSSSSSLLLEDYNKQKLLPLLTKNDIVVGIGFASIISFVIGFFLIGNGQNAIRLEKSKRRPINGGYDRKSLADRPIRLQSILDYFATINKSPSTTTTSEGENYYNIYNIVDTHTPTTTTASSSSSSSSSWLYERVYPYAKQIHSKEYLQLLETTSKTTDRPIRLNPRYSRTLMDQHSFEAAFQAAADWMACVDNALSMSSSSTKSSSSKQKTSDKKKTLRILPNKPKMALVRPPSHHACQSYGMGGCLLNSISIAALYALQEYSTCGIENVAILDIDAHHGNGIAHCIQDYPFIRYCSIHEQVPLLRQKSSYDSKDNPRSSEEDDFGPLNNIRNFCLPSKTGWDTGYRQILEDYAIPFIKYGDVDQQKQKPVDLLLVAAGFDALESDWTSTLQLRPHDYYEISNMLKQHFPKNNVIMGLEGGYSWESGDLSKAVDEFMKPWYD